MYGKAICFSGKRIAAVLNSLRNNIRGEVGYWIIKRTLLEEPLLDNQGGRVACMGNGGDKLFWKISCNFFVAGEGFGGKGVGLWKGFRLLCHWGICLCPTSVMGYTCGSIGPKLGPFLSIGVSYVSANLSDLWGAESVSFDDEWLGDFCEVERYVRDVTLGDLVFCEGVKDFAELGLTRAAGGR